MNRDDYELPVAAPAPGPWIDDANCSGKDISLFYPPSGKRPLEALLLCEECAVRAECLEYALDNHQHWGVWGGMTERQRFAEKRRRRRQEWRPGGGPVSTI